jgi:hypothetical protein
MWCSDMPKGIAGVTKALNGLRICCAARFEIS